MHQALLFTHADRRRLGSLLLSHDARTRASWGRLDELLWQLESSAATDPESVPHDVVTMHSSVRLVSESSGETMTRSVVYPEDVDLFDDAASVLGPLGSSLIGCEVGDVVECREGAEPVRWRIADISYQPEREGDFHR